MARVAAALPSVLLALALASAIAVGGAYVARQQAGHARFSQRGLTLIHSAERSLVDALTGWDSVARAGQAIAEEVALPAAADSGIVTTVWITRTSPTLFWLVARAQTGARPTLQRRIGLLVTIAGGQPRPVTGHAWADLP